MLRTLRKKEINSVRRKAIARVGRQYVSQCAIDNIPPWPVQYQKIAALLCTHVINNNSARSLDTILSSLRKYILLKDQKWLTERDDYRLKRLIKTLHYNDPSTKKVRLAATMEVIYEVSKTLDLNKIEEQYFHLTMLLAHNGLFRGGELFRKEGLKVKDLIWDQENNEVGFILRRDKTNRKGESTIITIRDYNGDSAYKALLKWFNNHKLWKQPERYVLPFIKRAYKGKVTLDFNRKASQSRWNKDIKLYFSRAGLPGELYSGHSFRAGGATDLFSANVPYPQIKKMGRWVSDAALIYFKAADRISVAVALGFEHHSYRLQKKQVSIRGTGEQHIISTKR